MTGCFLPAPYEFEGFQLDVARFELRRTGHVLKLEKIPMELLILLISKQGELVCRGDIIEKIWGRHVFIETEHGINTAVRKIRQTLGDDPERPRFVQTVVGKGYRFVAAVSSGAANTSPSNGTQLKSGDGNGVPSADEADEVATRGEPPPEAIPNGVIIASPISSDGRGAVLPATTGPKPERRLLKSTEARGRRWYASALFAAGTAATVLSHHEIGLQNRDRLPCSGLE